MVVIKMEKPFDVFNLLGILSFRRHIHDASINEIYNSENFHFVYPAGKLMIPHLLRYQGLAVDDYSFALSASDLGHPKLSLI